MGHSPGFNELGLGDDSSFLSVFKFCSLSTSRMLWRCSSLQVCMALLPCSLISIVLLG